MNITLYPDTMIPRLPQRSPPVFDVEGQPSYLTLADTRSPVNARPCHYAIACDLSKSEGSNIMMATHQSVLHKIDGLIPYPLTQIPNYSCQRTVADIWYPCGNKPH